MSNQVGFTRKFVRRRSLRSYLISWFLRRSFKPKLINPDFDAARFRRALDRDMGRNPAAAGVDISSVEQDGIRGEWNIPAGQPAEQTILFCHGGGYLFGSPLAYRSFTTQLAKRAGARVFVLDYRLAPEHPFPAAAEDALAAYRDGCWNRVTLIRLCWLATLPGLVYVCHCCCRSRRLDCPCRLRRCCYPLMQI